jgi:hypothetical protein
MDIKAIFRAVLAPDQERAAEQFAHLKVGDRLSGRVLKLETDGRLLIDLGRFKALAETTLPVQVGQRLTLKVTQMGEPIQLRLEADTQAVAQQPPHPRMALATLLNAGDQQRVVNTIERLLKALPSAPQVQSLGEAGGRAPTVPAISTTASAESPLLPDAAALAKGSLPEPVRQALTQLKGIFEPMPLDAPAAQRTQWVQATVEDRGILFELKLADAVEQATQRPAPAQLPTAEALKAPTPPAGKAPTPPAGETLPEAKVAPDAKGVADPKSGLDPALILASETDSEAPAAPDSKLALELKTQAGARGETESSAKSPGVPSAKDAQAAEQAQRIIARDLKPHLLVLKNFLGGLEAQDAAPQEAHAKDVAFLRQAVNQLTAHVEQQQEQAVRRSGEPDLYQVFTHLLPVKDQQQPVQLKVYYPKKGRPAEDDPQHRVSLLLMLDRLGPVRVDLAMVERSLRIGFYVRDPQVQQVFEAHGQTVADALAGVFDQVQISTQVSKEKIAQFEGEDLVGPPVGRIDVQV